MLCANLCQEALQLQAPADALSLNVRFVTGAHLALPRPGASLLEAPTN